MHKLTIEDDEGKTVVVPLVRDELTVGRQEGNTIRLTERNVSRKHARFRKHEGGIVLEDLGSFNGLKVNGVRIAALTPLKDGDVVLLGDYRLTFRDDKASATLLHPAGGPATPVGTAAAAAPKASPAASAAAPFPSAALVAPTVPIAQSPFPPAIDRAPVPDGMSEGAPTIPVRTLADQGMDPYPAMAPAAAAPPPARLVVVSTNLKGAEFLLDRPSLVIGRTPENDVILNHKSISRHHAKILHEGDKYLVVDLESANGVRVNGSEFERIELQSGDTVELGHVRLRFVAGDEAFSVGLAAGENGGRTKMFLVLGTAVVVVLGAVVALTGGEKKTTTAAVENAKAPAEPQKNDSPTVVPTRDSPEIWMARAKAGIEKEAWAEAGGAIDKVLLSAAGDAEALAMKKMVAAEVPNADRFAAARNAVTEKRFEDAVAAAESVPDGSVYRARAQAVGKDARGKAVAVHVAAAQKARLAGQCDVARSEAEAALGLEAGHAGAQAVVDGCAKVAAAAPAPRTSGRTATARPAAVARPAVVRPTPESAAEPAPVAAPKVSPPSRPAAVAVAAPEAPGVGSDAETVLQEARQAWLRGQFAAAIEGARKALRMKPSLVGAHQIIAISSCALRDTEDARKSYDKLDDRLKGMVKQACQKNGVVLD